MDVIHSSIPGILVTVLSICFLKVPLTLKSISFCTPDKIEEKEKNYLKTMFLLSKKAILMLKSKNFFFKLFCHFPICFFFSRLVFVRFQIFFFYFSIFSGFPFWKTNELFFRRFSLFLYPQLTFWVKVRLFVQVQ